MSGDGITASHAQSHGSVASSLTSPHQPQAQGQPGSETAMRVRRAWGREETRRGGAGASLEQASSVQHGQECGQERPRRSHPEPLCPGDSAHAQLLLRCRGLCGGALPRDVLQGLCFGALGHMDAKGMHRLVLVLLQGVVRPRAQRVATDGEVRGAAREWLAGHVGSQHAGLAQLRL